MYGQHYYLTILGTVVDTHRLNYSSLTSSILQSLVTHQQFERNTYTTQVSQADKAIFSSVQFEITKGNIWGRSQKLYYHV